MNKSLAVIDLQNDITKNYRDIIGNVNKAIEIAKTAVCLSYISNKTSLSKERGRLRQEREARRLYPNSTSLRTKAAKRVKRIKCTIKTTTVLLYNYCLTF